MGPALLEKQQQVQLAPLVVPQFLLAAQVELSSGAALR